MFISQLRSETPLHLTDAKKESYIPGHKDISAANIADHLFIPLLLIRTSPLSALATYHLSVLISTYRAWILSPILKLESTVFTNTQNGTGYSML